MTWWELALIFVGVAVVGVALAMRGADYLFDRVELAKPSDPTAPDPTAPGNSTTVDQLYERFDHHQRKSEAACELLAEAAADHEHPTAVAVRRDGVAAVVYARMGERGGGA